MTPMKIVSPNVKDVQHPQQLKPPTRAQMFAQGEESTSDKGEGGSEGNRDDRQCTYINLLSLNHNPNPDPNQQQLKSLQILTPQMKTMLSLSHQPTSESGWCWTMTNLYICHIPEFWLSPTPMISRHLQSHLQSCIATSLYAREVIMFYFTNIDNLYTVCISLYFTILVLQSLQLQVH